MATFNEFQRELQRRGIDPQNAYMFTLIYERMIEQAKMIDQCSKLLSELTNAVSGFVQLHEATQGQVKALLRGNMPDGVSVQSVADDPDTE